MTFILWPLWHLYDLYDTSMTFILSYFITSNCITFGWETNFTKSEAPCHSHDSWSLSINRCQFYWSRSFTATVGYPVTSSHGRFVTGIFPELFEELTSAAEGGRGAVGDLRWNEWHPQTCLLYLTSLWLWAVFIKLNSPKPSLEADISLPWLRLWLMTGTANEQNRQ